MIWLVSRAGIEPERLIDTAQLIDSTSCQKRQNRYFRRSEVHGGYTDYEFASRAAGEPVERSSFRRASIKQEARSGACVERTHAGVDHHGPHGTQKPARGLASVVTRSRHKLAPFCTTQYDNPRRSKLATQLATRNWAGAAFRAPVLICVSAPQAKRSMARAVLSTRTRLYRRNRFWT